MIIMAIIVILSVVLFSGVLCTQEIPRMLKSGSYKDLWTFSILLALGVILVILKCLKVTLPNPSDLLAWVFSPFSDFLRDMQK